MAEYASYKETSSRHLRFKLQSLSRRLDELEEATKNLQKAEDELLDLQDKVIQAEGSNSSMLADVEVLRKRVLKIEGKDEEIRKAEELCRLMKEKLEEEEGLTRELKSEIERLQKRMAELEKLEEAFGRSKNDCTQLCFSLNEEKNLTKKISTELEVLRVKVKELEQSEDRLDKTELSLVSELEKMKSLALVFISEKKHFSEKEKQNEKLIQELTQKLEQNNKLNRADQTRNASNLLERSTNSILERNDLRIEADLTTPALTSKETRRKGSFDYLKLVENETRNKSENIKNKNQEDNKVKDLNQEIEMLKTQIKHFESLEEELKTLRAKNNDLQESFLSEQNKNKLLVDQLEEIKVQMRKQKELENGKAENDETSLPSRVKPGRPKHRAVAAESTVSKQKTRELSPQHRRERIRNREFSFNNESCSQGNKRVPSPNLNSRRAAAKASSTSALLDTFASDSKRTEDKSAMGMHFPPHKDCGTPQTEVKKSREQPSVLSRYPPAAQEHKSWKSCSKPKNESALSSKVEKASQPFNDACHSKSSAHEEKLSKAEAAIPFVEKGNLADSRVLISQTRTSKSNHGPSNGAISSYRRHLSVEMLAAEPTSSNTETTASVSSRRSPLEENPTKVVKSQDREHMDSELEMAKPLPLSKSWLISRSQEDLLKNPKPPRKEETDQTIGLELCNSSNDGVKPASTRSKAVKLGGHDKFGTDEPVGKLMTPASTSDSEIKKESVSHEFSSSRGALRNSPTEKNRNAHGDDQLSQSSRASSAATGLKCRRSFSPREALRSKAVIKPAIVEKDVKEVMGNAGPEANSEKQPAGIKTVLHKMTSSITIYPSEPVTPRTNANGAAKEQQQQQQHMSTSNVRAVPNELSPGANTTSTHYELSINKSSRTSKLPETDKNGDSGLGSRVDAVVSKCGITIKPFESIEKNCETPVETINWKSHGSSNTVNSSETKHVTVRNAWRARRGLLSSEDSTIKATENATSRNPYKSSTDASKVEGTSARIYAIEQNSRRASAAVNSWSTPELDSRRTKSSLSASEMLSQRCSNNDPAVASPWNCTVLPVKEEVKKEPFPPKDFAALLEEENKDFVPSSRRKQFGSSEQLAWADSTRKRPDAKLDSHHQLPGGKTEERIRWSKGYQ